jgi:hypothetical protein
MTCGCGATYDVFAALAYWMLFPLTPSADLARVRFAIGCCSELDPSVARFVDRARRQLDARRILSLSSPGLETTSRNGPRTRSWFICALFNGAKAKLYKQLRAMFLACPWSDETIDINDGIKRPSRPMYDTFSSATGRLHRRPTAYSLAYPSSAVMIETNVDIKRPSRPR